MKRFLNENYYLIFLWILYGIALFFYMGHFSNILIDFGREVYYPQRILEGKVLYKDLFVIYGPFAYLFNALLYKIFGTNISSLYLTGICTSFLIISGIYFTAGKFLSKFLSFAVGIFTISVGLISCMLHNYFFPYSWAMLYGAVCFIYSVLFLIKYKQQNKNSYLYLSSLLGGVCISCKYEFAVFSLLLFIYLIYNCRYDWKTGLKSILAFCSVPVLCTGTLLIQGLRISNLIYAYNDIKSITNTETLKYFYERVGIYFNPKIIPILLKTFIYFLISIGILCAGKFLSAKNKFLSILVTIIGVIVSFVCFLFTRNTAFSFLPILFTVTVLLSINNIKKNVALIILAVSALSVCFKSFFGFIIFGYSTYIFPSVVTAFLAVVFSRLDKKYMNVFALYLILFSIINFFYAPFLSGLNSKITTSKGYFYTNKLYANAANDVIDFIANNTDKDDKIVIFPEGLTINFLTDRKGDDYYNSMLPLYIESFGEKRIVEHFEKNKPEFFILTNENMSDYGFKHICNDYAFGLCEFININYELIKTVDYDYRYLIFKRK